MGILSKKGRRAGKSSARQLWKQAHQLRDTLPAYSGDIDALRQAIEKERGGRPIKIIRLVASLGQQTGLWIPLPHMDLIFISGDLPDGLERQTILHELAHIVYDHQPIHLETRLRQAGDVYALEALNDATSPAEQVDIVTQIVSDLFADDKQNAVCGRAKDDFVSVEEQQAEMLSRLFMADEMNAAKSPADAAFGTY